MKNIRFSVVIPAYNASESIANTLDCIVAQTYKNLEVIIIDDKSSDSDELASIVHSEKYHHLDIQLLLSDIKLNGAGARNKGIALASGDYISFLDADDEWHPNKLLENLKLINELQEKDISKYIIYSQVNIYQDGNYLKTMPVRPVAESESVAEYLFGCYGFMQTSSLVLQREYAADILFDPAFVRHQDYDFCIRADKKGYTFILLDKPLVNYHLFSSFGSKQKGESVNYSFYWLSKMKPFLTCRDVNTYMAYKLPLRYKMDGKPLMAMFSLLRYFFLTNRENRKYFIMRLKEKIVETLSLK